MKLYIHRYFRIVVLVLISIPFFVGYPSTINPSVLPLSVGSPLFESPHTSPIVVNDKFVYVTNTPSGTVDVIDKEKHTVFTRIAVGVDPVSLAVRPDGKEVWVSNHISDSVNVIDTDPESWSYHQVVATIQDIDPYTKETKFDEPVGIAFANNKKAYIALSSENQIAVINVSTKKITRKINISAQDPRSLFVRGNKLYVIPFESGNQTQLSGGMKVDGDLVTFDAYKHSVENNNVLSIGVDVDIVKHPSIPDKDLFVFDTETDKLLEIFEGLGTLLYGLTVNAKQEIYIAQTDARNHVNGRAGTLKHTLKDLENRPFLNRITKIGKDISFFDLDPLLTEKFNREKALATPYSIDIGPDDETLFVTSSGSNKVFSLNVKTGEILSRVTVGKAPRGIKLEDKNNNQHKAWVYNAIDNSVTVLDVSDPKDLKKTVSINLYDSTNLTIKYGRELFHSAELSLSGTFSCESCHPNGNTDQLLWVLNAPKVSKGDRWGPLVNQIPPRNTMPIRGLADTAPYHWDGTLGDPYGGKNSSSLNIRVPANCSLENPNSCIRHLTDATISGVMSSSKSATKSDVLNHLNNISNEQRDALSKYLLSVSYPPAQRRPFTNVVSKEGYEGFRLFHIDGDLNPKLREPNVCGNCHRMPLWTSTHITGSVFEPNGMDAPTWRGAYDRFLILPQGRLNIIGFNFISKIAERGWDERTMWRLTWSGLSGPRINFDPVWKMVLEGSTGYSGSFGRQVTINQVNNKQSSVVNFLEALELSAREGGVVLEASGALHTINGTQPLSLQYGRSGKIWFYKSKKSAHIRFDRDTLLDYAESGKLMMTFSARHGSRIGIDNPQPLIWTLTPLHLPGGRQVFPTLVHGENNKLEVHGRHFDESAHIYVDGRRVPGVLFSLNEERWSIHLGEFPNKGMHLLQIQIPQGKFSNDFIFHVVKND